MKKSAEEHRVFNEDEILASEPRFIDIYTENADKIKPIRLLFSFYKGHYGLLALSALLNFIKSIPTWLLPIITAELIDIIIKPGDDALMQIGILFSVALVSIAQNVPVNLASVKIFSKISRSVEAGLRGAMIRKLQQLSIAFHKDMESGKIQSKIMRDVETITDLTHQLMNTVFSAGLDLIISLAVILSGNITVFLVFLVSVPIIVLAQHRNWSKMREKTHEFRKEIEHTASAVYDMEELIPVTRAHALEHKEVKKLTSDITGVAEKGRSLDMVFGWVTTINWASMTVIRTVCLFFTAFLAFQGEISVGDISLYQSYFGSLMGQLHSLINLLPTMSRGTESIRSIGEIIGAFDVEDNDGKQPVKTLKGDYEFRSVEFNYDPRSRILKGLDLKVKAGETVALVGESGSGKTTIINMIIGFYHANKGEVLIDGQNIEELDLHSYRRHLSVVPQNTILFSGTVRENITYGRDDISEEQLWEVIRAARLEDTIKRLPDGLETNVGEHGGKLSGGQRQRISIARAIIRDPSVIIFDEATSALDTATEREIQMAIDNLTRNRTTFIVAHRLSTIKGADKVAVIRNGRCVEFGSYQELLAKKGEFYKLRQAQI